MASMDNMQKEAMRRVQEMQSKAHSQPEKNQNTTKVNHEKETTYTKTEPLQNTPEKIPVVSSNGSVSNALDFLMKDKEKSLIMLLILLLANEGADNGLLLALMYLII